MQNENDPDKPFYRLSAEDTADLLNTGESGLTEQEVKKRRKQTGLNRLAEKKEKSLFQLFVSQLNNPVIYLLVAAAAISFIFSDIPEGIAIIVVILLNTLIGFWMEYQARGSMKALKKIDKLKTRVIRNGELTEIDAEYLVPGDVINLEAGNLVPADARILSASEFTVDESPMTGESVPVEKSAGTLDKEAGVADRTNMVFKGTAITGGKAQAAVTATGMNTEIGNISRMVSEAGEEEIPLNKKLEKLAHRLIWVTLGMAVLFLVFGWLAGKEIYLLLQTSIAWTVAAIPEGLPIVASIALARGMLRLAKHNVIVKKLAAVETLGETTMIFTDKTGTLTENKLTLSMIMLSDKEGPQEVDIKWEGGRPRISGKYENNAGLDHIFNISVLCNDANIEDSDKPAGDPLEIALLQFAEKHNKEKYQDVKNWERINEDPFDSETKIMGTVYKKGGQLYIAGKGAAAPMLSRCSHYLIDSNKKPVDDEFRARWIEMDNAMSAKGLRVIAMAYKEVPEDESDSLSTEEDFVRDMTFTGLTGFIDPARSEIAEAVETCHHAGIKVVMVTGDHPETSLNIARQVKLVDEDTDLVIHGKELSEEMDGAGEHNSDFTASRIFARVDPGQKLKIIERFKKDGEITGMTGDGVNDAPALKKADIGIAMGKRGTQVAQEVADMVLKDDAFPSIVKAIEQGRIIFGNIRKFITYQLSYHLSEIIIIAAISFSLFYLPLLPLQLLFLNLLSDVFPALALGVGKGNPAVMERPPKDPDEPIITGKNWLTIFIYGIIIAVYVTGAYIFSYYVMELSEEICNNVAFFSLAFAQLLHVTDMRDPDEGVFINQVTRNKYIWFALGFCIVALMIAYMVPLLHNVLSFQQLTATTWLIIGITGILPVVTIQILKEVFRM